MALSGKKRGVAMFKVVALVAALTVSAVVLAQSGPASAPVIVSGVELGSHVSSDLTVPVPKTIFKPTDNIHAVVTTHAAANTVGTLGVLWTYGSGDDLQAVHDDSREIAFKGDANFDFEISNPALWPEGTYQVEVFLNGVSVAKRRLIVR